MSVWLYRQQEKSRRLVGRRERRERKTEEEELEETEREGEGV